MTQVDSAVEQADGSVAGNAQQNGEVHDSEKVTTAQKTVAPRLGLLARATASIEGAKTGLDTVMSGRESFDPNLFQTGGDHVTAVTKWLGEALHVKELAELTKAAAKLGATLVKVPVVALYTAGYAVIGTPVRAAARGSANVWDRSWASWHEGGAKNKQDAAGVFHQYADASREAGSRSKGRADDLRRELADRRAALKASLASDDALLGFDEKAMKAARNKAHKAARLELQHQTAQTAAGLYTAEGTRLATAAAERADKAAVHRTRVEARSGR